MTTAMKLHPVIAIDGPAASGKSTIAREVARTLGWIYVNTGSMYRAVTWKLLDEKIPTDQADCVVRYVEALKITCEIVNGELLIRLNGMDPLPHVREPQVNDHVSQVACIPEVRHVLVARQRDLAQHAPLVMEGRDIGTVVFPDTPHKFFIDASPEVRARRRLAQGEQDVIQARDLQDASRATSPLMCAADAIRIDTSDLSIAETVALIIRRMEKQGIAIA